MGKFDLKAKGIFAKYSGQDTLYFTSDGQAFFENNPASNHGKTLGDKNVVSVNRADVAEGKPAAEKPKADAPKVDEPKADEPKADESKVPEPKADEPSGDTESQPA